MRFLLFQNLKLTIPTALAFAVLGYFASVPMCFIFDPYAASWRFNINKIGQSIETERLLDLDKFRAMVVLGSVVLGIIIAQTTFVVQAFLSKHSRND